MQVPAAFPITFLSVSLESWLTIAAIIIGPFAALLIQKYLENRRATKDQKIKVFRDLMAHRANRTSLPYVQALNGIEVEFYGHTKVIEAWRSLVDQLYVPYDDQHFAQWSDHVTELLNNLLYEMGISLGYHFDKVTLKRNVYFPKGWNTMEIEQMKLRQAAVKVFEGEKPLNIKVTNE